MESHVYVFNNPNKSKFPSAVFSTKENAEQWIKKNLLSGVLTKYPMDIGIYEWAIQNEFFIKKDNQDISPDFIAGFSSASQEHYHYEDGISLD
jgi:hypothetical protein